MTSKYDSPVAMPTVVVKSSYEEGYRCGYFSGAIAYDNPYVDAEGAYDHSRWEQGRWDGRFHQWQGKPALYQSAEN